MRALGLIAAILLLAAPIGAKSRESELPKKFQRSPYSAMSLSVGHPNAGWQLRPSQLKGSRFIHIKNGSEDTNWGHPALVKMLRRNARDVSRAIQGGSVMLVGDLSAKNGGPLAGHHSHQSGRDADVAFFASDARGKPVELDRFVAFGADGKARDDSGYVFDDHRNWLLVQAWLKDHRAGLSYIFVSTPLRARLLAYAAKHPKFKKHVEAAAALLKQPENAEAHDDHFHLRITCPERQREICHEEPRSR